MTNGMMIDDNIYATICKVGTAFFRDLLVILGTGKSAIISNG
jgi:hypothetical protein